MYVWASPHHVEWCLCVLWRCLSDVWCCLNKQSHMNDINYSTPTPHQPCVVYIQGSCHYKIWYNFFPPFCFSKNKSIWWFTVMLFRSLFFRIFYCVIFYETCTRKYLLAGRGIMAMVDSPIIIILLIWYLMFRQCLMTSTKSLILWAADINSAFIIFNENILLIFCKGIWTTFFNYLTRISCHNIIIYTIQCLKLQITLK